MKFLAVFLFPFISTAAFGGLRNAIRIDITDSKATVSCADGSQTMASLEDVRADRVCGQPETTALKKLSVKHQFDFNGYCEVSDQQNATEIVKNHLVKTASSECYTAGFSKTMSVDFVYELSCRTYFGPLVDASYYFRCSF